MLDLQTVFSKVTLPKKAICFRFSGFGASFSEKREREKEKKRETKKENPLCVTVLPKQTFAYVKVQMQMLSSEFSQNTVFSRVSGVNVITA